MWSDIPNNRQMRITEEDGHVSTFRNPWGYSNGNTFDFEGRQLSCEHAGRRVVRYEHMAAVTMIADKWNGKPLNSPNDIVVHPDGSIWFTDPPYGILGNYEGHRRSRKSKRRSTAWIRRRENRDGDRRTRQAQRHLFLAGLQETLRLRTGTPRDIQVFDVADNKLTASSAVHRHEVNGKQGGSDGIRADVDGNIWAGAIGGAGYDGVHVFAPDGQRIGMILLPEICANLCFGGTKRNRLFMAASQSLYSLYVGTRGAHYRSTTSALRGDWGVGYFARVTSILAFAV